MHSSDRRMASVSSSITWATTLSTCLSVSMAAVVDSSESRVPIQNSPVTSTRVWPFLKERFTLVSAELARLMAWMKSPWVRWYPKDSGVKAR